jgi:hypothetical protein
MSRAPLHQSEPRVAEFESLLADLFRQAAWRVYRDLKVEGVRADFVAEHGRKKYVVELKRSSEWRRARIIPQGKSLEACRNSSLRRICGLFYAICASNILTLR